MQRQIYLFIVSCFFILLTTVAQAGLKQRKPTAKAYIPKYSSIVMDAQTGQILEQEDAHGIRHPASLTKVMTLYLAFEALKSGRLSLNTKMTTSSKASRQSPSKFGLVPGEQITVYQAVMGLVTKSANDVAVVFAEHLAGSEEAFARRMTQKAKTLGMKKTIFKNASGLPNSGQVTTAYDMAVLSRALYQHFPEQYKYFKSQSFTHKGTVHRNHNHLLGKVPGLDGIKTGFIVASGFNLAASAVRYDAAQRAHRLITIVLGGPNRHWRDRRVTELLETNFHKMGLPSSAATPPKITSLVLKKSRDRVLETIEDEGVFIQPAVDVIDDKKNIDEVLDTIIEASAKQSPVATKGISSADSSATTRAKPANWVVPVAAKQSSPKSSSSKIKKKPSQAYTVQVGLYRDHKQARRHARQARALMKDGQVQVASKHRGKKKLIAAQVTGLSETQAKNLCRQLHKKGKECLLMR